MADVHPDDGRAATAAGAAGPLLGEELDLLAPLEHEAATNAVTATTTTDQGPGV